MPRAAFSIYRANGKKERRRASASPLGILILRIYDLIALEIDLAALARDKLNAYHLIGNRQDRFVIGLIADKERAGLADRLVDVFYRKALVGISVLKL